MTEPEPAANPQALTEEMVEAASQIFWEHPSHWGGLDPTPWSDLPELEKEKGVETQKEIRKAMRDTLTAAVSITRPAADRGQIVEELINALKHCLGILCEAGNLNNYRNLSDAELGKAWTETAKEAAAVLNRAEALSPAPAQTEDKP